MAEWTKDWPGKSGYYWVDEPGRDKRIVFADVFMSFCDVTEIGRNDSGREFHPDTRWQKIEVPE